MWFIANLTLIYTIDHRCALLWTATMIARVHFVIRAYCESFEYGLFMPSLSRVCVTVLRVWYPVWYETTAGDSRSAELSSGFYKKFSQVDKSAFTIKWSQYSRPRQTLRLGNYLWFVPLSYAFCVIRNFQLLPARFLITMLKKGFSSLAVNLPQRTRPLLRQVRQEILQTAVLSRGVLSKLDSDDTPWQKEEERKKGRKRNTLFFVSNVYYSCFSSELIVHRLRIFCTEKIL